MVRYPTPTRESYYWGKLVLVADGSDTSPKEPNDNDLRSVDWEVVSVYVNGGDPKGSEYLMVMVPGIGKPQPIDAFIWGPEIPLPSELKK